MRSAVSSIKCLHEKVFYQEPGKFMLTKIIDSTVLGEFLLSRVYAKTGGSLLSCVLAMTGESLISLCTGTC